MADDPNTGLNLDQFTEISTQGWLSRIGGGFIGLLIGLLLIPCAVGLLAWNEIREVSATNSLNRGLGSVIEVSPQAVNPVNNNKLVYSAGQLNSVGVPTDPLTGVVGVNALRLRRNVEMYQWVESSHTVKINNVGGSQTTERTYSYETQWASVPHRSEQFKNPAGHENPSMDVQSQTFNANEIRLGAFILDNSLVDKLSNFSPMESLSAPPKGYQLSANVFFKGVDSQQPQVGDTKISYAVVTEQPYSIAAKQFDGKFIPYQDAKSGYTIDLIEAGIIPSKQLFADQQSTEVMVTWGLRALGFVVLFLGFKLLFGPIEMLAAFLPFLESLAGIASGLIAFCLAIPVGLITIAIFWIASRPALGISVLAVGLFAAFCARWVFKGKRTAS